jgi:hypothetical protein
MRVWFGGCDNPAIRRWPNAAQFADLLRDADVPVMLRPAWGGSERARIPAAA